MELYCRMTGVYFKIDHFYNGNFVDHLLIFSLKQFEMNSLDGTLYNVGRLWGFILKLIIFITEISLIIYSFSVKSRLK